MSKEINMLSDLSKFRFRTTFISMEYPFHLLSPVWQSMNEKNTEVSLIDLGNALGQNLQNETFQSSLERQQKRFIAYKRLYVGFSAVGYILIGLPVVILIVLIARPLGFGDFAVSLSLRIIMYFFMLLIAYVAFKTANRIVSVLLDRYYADTLSFVTCLYLLASLVKHDALANPRDRRQLLARIRALRKYVILLPHQYATGSLPPNSLAPTQFRCIAQFIEDKENQIIAPCTNSQNELFFELQGLLNVLLSANYGEFKYENSITQANASPPSKDSNSAFGEVLKFVGTILPLVLLLLMYFFPAQFRFLGIENRVIALISLAWLLLAIDANLNLGVVDRLSSLAKALKDLA